MRSRSLISALALGVLAQVTINLYDPQSRNAGYARVNPKTGSVDIYDPSGKRLGYGRVQGKDLDVFKPDGERLLTGKPAPATPRSSKP